MKFCTFGDFPILLDNYGNIPDDLSSFWSLVGVGLRNAKGCYVFGIRTSGGSSVYPWYVGRTLKSFKSECFQFHKRVLYGKALNFYKRKTPCLFSHCAFDERRRFLQRC